MDEKSVEVVQVVTFDESAGIRIVEVPKHLNMMKTTHVTDLDDERLTLQVYDDLLTCYIGESHQHLNHKDEKEALGNFNRAYGHNKKFSSSKALHYDFIFIPGAHITHNDLPMKLRKYCPTDFDVQEFRYIRMENIVTVPESGEIIVQDDNEVRRDRRMQSLQSCCPHSHVYNKCKNTSGGEDKLPSSNSCEYIPLCSEANNPDCTEHVVEFHLPCQQCCQSKDCGRKLPKCQSEKLQVDSYSRFTFAPSLELSYTKLHNRTIYAPIPAQILILYEDQVCYTNELPAGLPQVHRYVQKITLDTKFLLGLCWDINLNHGDPKTLRVFLLLPDNSPIRVSKVRVKDGGDRSRCWSAWWDNSDYNQRTGQFIEASQILFDRGC